VEKSIRARFSLIAATAQPRGAAPPLAPVSREIEDVLAEWDAVARRLAGHRIPFGRHFMAGYADT